MYRNARLLAVQHAHGHGVFRRIVAIDGELEPERRNHSDANNRAGIRKPQQSTGRLTQYSRVRSTLPGSKGNFGRAPVGVKQLEFWRVQLVADSGEGLAQGMGFVGLERRFSKLNDSALNIR